MDSRGTGGAKSRVHLRATIAWIRMPSGIERSRCTQNWVDEVRTELGRAEGSTEHSGLLGALSGPVRDEGMLDSQEE